MKEKIEKLKEKYLYYKLLYNKWKRNFKFLVELEALVIFRKINEMEIVHKFLNSETQLQNIYKIVLKFAFIITLFKILFKNLYLIRFKIELGFIYTVYLFKWKIKELIDFVKKHPKKAVIVIIFTGVSFLFFSYIFSILFP
jgi:hypothetical protein